MANSPFLFDFSSFFFCQSFPFPIPLFCFFFFFAFLIIVPTRLRGGRQHCHQPYHINEFVPSRGVKTAWPCLPSFCEFVFLSLFSSSLLLLLFLSLFSYLFTQYYLLKMMITMMTFTSTFVPSLGTPYLPTSLPLSPLSPCACDSDDLVLCAVVLLASTHLCAMLNVRCMHGSDRAIK